jgi:hypothetical protein
MLKFNDTVKIVDNSSDFYTGCYGVVTWFDAFDDEYQVKITKDSRGHTVKNDVKYSFKEQDLIVQTKVK